MKRTELGMWLLALAAAAGMMPALGAGVVATPGAKTEFTVPLDAAGIAELADNGGVVEARVGLWVPSDFDPAREWYILLVSATADGGGLSVSAMDAFLPAAQSAGGWIVMAADGTTRPGYDDDPYRWAVMRAGLQALAERWPAAREWPVAAGGFSGGAKFSGLMGGRLHKNGYTLVGMWMGGCNEDMASTAMRSYAPGGGFLDVPIFLSSGRGDTIATPTAVAWVRRSMEETGFSNVRLDSHPGGHTLYGPHAEDGLRWFVNMDGRGRTTATLDPQGGEGGNRKVDVVAGQPLPAIAPPTWAGHAFEGYYSAAAGAGTQYYAADGTGIHVWDLEAGTVLYAAWSPLSYTLTLDPQGGTGGTDRVRAEYGALPPPIAVPTCADHAFGGYFGGRNGQGTQYYDAGGNGAAAWDVAADTTLYAYWKWTGGGDVAWEYRVEAGHAVVTGASPASGRLEIPAALDGFPVAAIGENAFFRETGLTEVVLPEGLTHIGDFAFNQCRALVAVSFPDSLEEIGYLAFNLCTALEAVDLGNRVRRIGGGAFRECDSLLRVGIPASVEDLGSGSEYGVFESCDSLTRIEVATGNGTYSSRGGVLFNKDGSTLLQYPAGKAGTYAIPAGVRSIASSAFAGCHYLAAVSGGRNLESIGTYAFEACWYLAEVTLPENVTEIGNYAFSACRALEGVDIPGSVVRIGDYAFNDCSALLRMDLPESVTELGGGAFWGCSSLSAVALPPGVASIRAYTFHGCSALPSLSIPGGVTNVGLSAFSGCTGLKTLYVPGSWAGMNMLANADLPEGCTVVYGAAPEGETTSTGVPHSWIDANAADILAANGGDHEGAAKAPAANGMPVWACYVAGLDPTEAGTKFTARISLEGGNPALESVSPDLGGERRYILVGKKDLLDGAWEDLTGNPAPAADGYRFFGAAVSLPE